MRRKTNRAFSLIELLVVIAIIALLIGILLPALAHVRNSGKTTDTRAMIKNIQDAIGQFQLDNGGRAPGLFNQVEMGSDANRDAGLSAMENILLELSAGAGLIGRVEDVDADLDAYGLDDTNGLIKVGIDDSDDKKQFYVNPKLIGVGDVPMPIDSRFLVAQTSDGSSDIGQDSSVVSSGDSHTGLANTQEPGLDDLYSMPDVIDAFGNPILVWIRDDYGPANIRTGDAADYDLALEDFVRDSSDDGESWFYLNANRAFLAANALGKTQFDQQRISGQDTSGSALGTTDAGAFAGLNNDNFMAIFGSPSYPDNPKKNTQKDILPTAPRGSIIFQAAGKDGVYFARSSKGYRQDGTNGMYYGYSFVNDGNETLDLTASFDDLIMTGR